MQGAQTALPGDRVLAIRLPWSRRIFQRKGGASAVTRACGKNLNKRLKFLPDIPYIGGWPCVRRQDAV